MKTWNYTVTSESVWTSFDYGEVEAETLKEALIKASAELLDYFNKANEVLAPIGLSVGYDERSIRLEEEKTAF